MKPSTGKCVDVDASRNNVKSNLQIIDFEKLAVWTVLFVASWSAAIGAAWAVWWLAVRS